MNEKSPVSVVCAGCVFGGEEAGTLDMALYAKACADCIRPEVASVWRCGGMGWILLKRRNYVQCIRNE